MVPFVSIFIPGIFFSKSSTVCSLPCLKESALKIMVSFLKVTGRLVSKITSFRAITFGLNIKSIVFNSLIFSIIISIVFGSKPTALAVKT